MTAPIHRHQRIRRADLPVLKTRLKKVVAMNEAQLREDGARRGVTGAFPDETRVRPGPPPVASCVPFRPGEVLRPVRAEGQAVRTSGTSPASTEMAQAGAMFSSLERPATSARFARAELDRLNLSKCLLMQ